MKVRVTPELSLEVWAHEAAAQLAGAKVLAPVPVATTPTELPVATGFTPNFTRLPFKESVNVVSAIKSEVSPVAVTVKVTPLSDS